MQNYFFNLSDKLFSQLSKDEILTCNLESEASDFVRFNKNKIRQAGHVNQQKLTLTLVNKNVQVTSSLQISGIEADDELLLKHSLQTMREKTGLLPDDPFLNISSEVHNTDFSHSNELPESGDMVNQILKKGNGMDLVGILANGIISNGFCSSYGQRNWHSNNSFNFDWSCYYESDKAVKNNYSGFEWQSGKISQHMQSANEQLEIIKKKSIRLKPDKYRVYLAPSALNEIIDMMCWNGFSLKGHRTKQTPLLKMITEDKELSASVDLIENNSAGLTPCFSEEGFIIPDKVKLIENGRYQQTLANARSAKEYNQATNCDVERPVSLAMSSGTINNDKILKVLDTGIYINNLWYCNFSDYNNCRITGMTRFACYWVENGVPIAPVSVMRFDETIYNILGSRLTDITADREQLIDPGSYGKRSCSSVLLPGIFVDDFSLTL